MPVPAKLGTAALAALLAALPAAAPAALVSASGEYRILDSEMPSVGNSQPKITGPYKLYGASKPLGNIAIAGGGYSMLGGVINLIPPAQWTLDAAHVYPNPCRARDGCNKLSFSGLTLDADIYVYTISGELVRKMRKTGNFQEWDWDLRNDAGSGVASGLYLFFIRSTGTTKKGKIIITR
jgi:hypothetical protein